MVAEAHAAETPVMLNDKRQVAEPQTIPEPWKEVQENHLLACVLVEEGQLGKKQTMPYSRDAEVEVGLAGQVCLGLADLLIA